MSPIRLFLVTCGALQLFEEKKVRTIWDNEQEKWYFAIVDVCHVLTDSKDYQTARKYWNKLKERLKNEGNETVTNCHQFKLRAADGKMRLTDVADTEQLFRIIQSIPSPKAEPFKQWMAQVAHQKARTKNNQNILFPGIKAGGKKEICASRPLFIYPCIPEAGTLLFDLWKITMTKDDGVISIIGSTSTFNSFRASSAWVRETYSRCYQLNAFSTESICDMA